MFSLKIHFKHRNQTKLSFLIGFPLIKQYSLTLPFCVNKVACEESLFCYRFLARPREALVLFETTDGSSHSVATLKHHHLEREIRTMVADMRKVKLLLNTNKVLNVLCGHRCLIIFKLGRAWILEQNYSLYDTYGEEFGDLIADIPDPTTLPLAILQDFLHILDDLGRLHGSLVT